MFPSILKIVGMVVITGTLAVTPVLTNADTTPQTCQKAEQLSQYLSEKNITAIIQTIEGHAYTSKLLHRLVELEALVPYPNYTDKVETIKIVKVRGSTTAALFLYDIDGCFMVAQQVLIPFLTQALNE